MSDHIFYDERKGEIIDSYINFLKLEIKKKDKVGNVDKLLLDNAIGLREVFEKNKKMVEGNLMAGLSKNPITVQLEITSKCNQSCIQCYNQSGLDKNKTNSDISIDKWIDIAYQLAEIPVSQVVISGGEPTLLKDDLFRIMDIFHNVGVHFIFISNGMLINEKNIKKLSKYNYAWMQFSVDGATEEVHDYIRGAKGAFKKVTNAITLARNAGIPVGVASVFMKNNIHQVSKIIDLAYNLGAYKSIVGEFMYTGRAIKNSEEIDLTDAEISRIGKILNKKAIQYSELMEIHRASDPAYALRNRLTLIPYGLLIRPDGEVRIDCQAPARIGNIMENDIQTIWNSLGNKSWSNPELLDYIDNIKSYKDLAIVKPRTYIDPDLDLTKN